ncbi:hypothetical protein RintRC_5509 [Richelia intracellularis]|nr:hypothetical protein RintRC_5509 [Richelia intracellularis]
MNIPELRQSLKLQWLNYYQTNRSWLVKMRIWCTCDGERRPLSSFILATLSVLEPQLEKLFSFILELSNNPDQIIAALGLNFNPERELNLVDTHKHDNSVRNHVKTQSNERSPWKNVAYDTPQKNTYITDDEVVQEQVLMENYQLMTMVIEEEVSESTVESSKSVANTTIAGAPQIPFHSRTIWEDRSSSPSTPTKISTTAATSSYPIMETEAQTKARSVPFHTFVLDEITGLFHQTTPGCRDVQQPPREESPAYTLGETISIPAMDADKQVTESVPQASKQAQELNQEEDVSELKKKRFNLASWVDDFCQGSGWDYEEAIFIRF